MSEPTVNAHTFLWVESVALAEAIMYSPLVSKVQAIDTSHLAQRIQDTVLDALEEGEL